MEKIDISGLVLQNLEPDKTLWMQRAQDALKGTEATTDEIRHFVNMFVQSYLLEAVSYSKSKEVSEITKKTRALADGLFASDEAIRHDFVTMNMFVERARIAARHPSSVSAGDLFRAYMEEQETPVNVPAILQPSYKEPEPWESEAPQFSSGQRMEILGLYKHSIAEWLVTTREILENMNYDASDEGQIRSFVFHVIDRYVREHEENGMATEPVAVTAGLIEEQMNETVCETNQWELTRMFEEFLATK